MLLIAVIAWLGSSRAADPCVEAGDKWRSAKFPQQEGTFDVEFDMVPGEAPMNGITGLSFGAAKEYDDLAASVRFSPEGVIDSRDGSEFEARARLPYKAGARYHVRMTVRMRQRTYDVHVTPPGGAEQALALNHRFRTEQDDLDSLNYWALFARDGRHEVCKFSGPKVEGVDDLGPEEAPGAAHDTTRQKVETPPAPPPEPAPAPRSGAAAVLVGAGDIGNCNTATDEATAKLLDRIEGTVFTVGDNAYPDGSMANFERCFE